MSRGCVQLDRNKREQLIYFSNLWLGTPESKNPMQPSFNSLAMQEWQVEPAWFRIAHKTTMLTMKK